MCIRIETLDKLWRREENLYFLLTLFLNLDCPMAIFNETECVLVER